MLRCNEHAAIRSMENEFAADPQVAELIEVWLSGFRTKESLGGLVRDSETAARRVYPA